MKIQLIKKVNLFGEIIYFIKKDSDTLRTFNYEELPAALEIFAKIEEKVKNGYPKEEVIKSIEI